MKTFTTITLTLLIGLATAMPLKDLGIFRRTVIITILSHAFTSYRGRRANCMSLSYRMALALVALVVTPLDNLAVVDKASE